ncbi:hypothetical protein D5S17_15425 [Pseudonocardiaceae bacterium YIM PH 21723]|nr:hypothetical protein D5S17_15425 [Pseudonocardiaceae bacterium YIM PH 21723]
MADHFEVVVEELEAHARKIDALGDRLRTAVQAANTTMNNMAFGLMGQPFAAAVIPFEQLGAQAITRGVETLGKTGDGIRRTGKTYHEQDQAEAARFR